MIKELAKAILPERPAFELKKFIYGRNRQIEKNLIKANTSYKGIHNGQRCFIIGNGPSMRYLDLGVLHDEITFTVNQIARRTDYKNLNATYHFWADERVFQIDLEKKIDLELYEIMKKVKDENNNPTVFYKSSAFNMVRKTGLDKVLNIHYFMEIACDMPSSSGPLQMDNIIPMFSTVVQYEIVAAVYMGIKEIFLLGCDTTGIINEIEARLDQDRVEYAYEVGQKEKERMKKSALQNTMQMELRGTAKILDDYEKLYQYCKNQGVKLVNLTPVTLIESIPKGKIDDILAHACYSPL